MQPTANPNRAFPVQPTANPSARGPQQAEILDTDAEILLEIRDPKSQAIFSGYFRKIRKFISRELHCATSGFVAQ